MRKIFYSYSLNFEYDFRYFSIGILIPLFANLTDQIKFDNDFFNLILNF